MKKFHKQIVVGTEARQFEFTEMRNVNGTKFFVTSKDEKDKPVSFSLKKKDAEWKLLPGSLRWLYAIESQLAEAIDDTAQ